MNDQTPTDTTPKRRPLLSAEDVNKWHKAAMRALGDVQARRKWADSKPGGPVTVMLLCEDVSSLQIERAEMLAAMKKVYDSLNARLDYHRDRQEPMPVFDGIADLHDIIGRSGPLPSTK